MKDQKSAAYLPLPTERTKNVVKHLQPGMRSRIDIVNMADAGDRLEADAWVEDDGDGIRFKYQDGRAGRVVNFGYADKVRVAIEEAPDAD